jgi:benzodiazapine receptor
METRRTGSFFCSVVGMQTRHPLAAAAAFIGATVATAIVGKIATKRSRGIWYRLLRKPTLQPPPVVYGPVWSTLYTLSTLSGLSLYRAQTSPARSVALGLYGAQQTFNALWSPIFFGSKRPRLALVDLGLLLGSLAGYTVAAAKADRRAAFLMLPTLAWVSFAGYLNAGVVRRNPRLLAG